MGRLKNIFIVIPLLLLASCYKSDNNYYNVNPGEFEIEDITSIDLNVKTTELYFHNSKSNNLEISCNKNFLANKQEKTYYIDSKEQGTTINIGLPNDFLNIEIKGIMLTFLYIDNLNLQTLNVDVENGSISISDSNIESINFKSTFTNEFYFQNSNIDNLNIRSKHVQNFVATLSTIDKLYSYILYCNMIYENVTFKACNIESYRGKYNFYFYKTDNMSFDVISPNINIGFESTDSNSKLKIRNKIGSVTILELAQL